MITGSMRQESYWLAAPLVTSGTAVAACAGCFRAPNVVEVVLDRQNELQLLSVIPCGKLVPVFKQPLFCPLRQARVLPFSQQAGSQALDHLVALLETGSLVVLRYSHAIGRFYIVSELQLSAGPSTDPDHLGWRLSVAPDASSNGITVAVSAARGRIACLTASLAPEGDVQLSTPVLYAAALPRVLGATDLGRNHQQLELGAILDIAVLSSNSGSSRAGHASGNNTYEQEQEQQHLAVLSHRHGEAATELVMFGWSNATKQLQKLWVVPLPHGGRFARMGLPASLLAVPGCSTAVVVVRASGICILDCSEMMQQEQQREHQAGRSSVEVMQHLTCYFQQDPSPHQRWLVPHALSCVAAKCLPAELKQSQLHGSRAGSGAAPSSAAAAAAAAATRAAAAWPPPADFMLPLLEDAGLHAGLGAGVAYADAAYAAAEDAGAVVAGGQQPADAAAGADEDAQLENAAKALRSLIALSDDEAEEGWMTPDSAQLDAKASPPVVELAKVTAVAWMAASAAAAAASSKNASPAAASARQSGAVDHLLISTSYDCLLQLSVKFSSSPSSSSLPSSFVPVSPTGGYISFGSSSGSSIFLMAASKVPLCKDSMPSSSSSTRCTDVQKLGAVLLPLPNQRLLVDVDSKSRLLLLETVVPESSRQKSKAAAAVSAVAAAITAAQEQDNGDATLEAVAPEGHEAAAAAAALGSMATGGLHLSPSAQPATITDAAAAGPGAGAVPAAAAEAMDISGSPERNGGGPGVAQTGQATGAVGAAPDAAQDWATSEVQQQLQQSAQRLQQQYRQMEQRLLHQMNQQGCAGYAPPFGGCHTPAVREGEGSKSSLAQQHTAAGEAAGQCYYSIANELPLLGSIGPCVVLPAAQQQQQPLQVSTPDPPTAGSSSSIERPPVLATARASPCTGIRVLRPQPLAEELLRGPVGMLEGANGIWPLAASPLGPESHESVALVISFCTGASRALSVGHKFQDVSDLLGLNCSESTVLAACVAEGLAAQVTKAGVQLCALDAVAALSSDNSRRTWRDSPKSSRSSWKQQQGPASMEWEQQQQQGGAVSLVPRAATAAGALFGPGSSAARDGSVQLPQPLVLPPAAAVAAGAGGTAGRQLQGSRLAVSRGAAEEACAAVTCSMDVGVHAAAGGAAAGADSTPPGSPNLWGLGPAVDAPPAGLNEQWHWSVQDYLAQQQQQTCLWQQVRGSISEQQAPMVSIVLAAAAAGIVVLKLSCGALVVLQVSCQKQQQQQQQSQQHQQQAQSMEPEVPMPVAAAVAGSAAGNSAGGTSTSLCKKRGRNSWSIKAVAETALDGQVSCLQVCPAPSAATVPCSAVSSAASSSSSSKRCSHLVIVGRYDGSLQVLAVQLGAGSVLPLASFSGQQLLPLQLLSHKLQQQQHNHHPDDTCGCFADLHAAPTAVPESCIVIPIAQQHLAPGARDTAAAVSAAAGAAAAAAAVGGGPGSSSGSRAGVNALTVVGGPSKRSRQSPALGAAAAASAAAISSSLLLAVSYRSGDVAVYKFDILGLLQLLQQQQQPQGEPVESTSDLPSGALQHMRVLSQIKLPGVVVLQMMPPNMQYQQQQQPVPLLHSLQQVLAVGERAWLLNLSESTSQITSSDVISQSVLLAAGLQLPHAVCGTHGSGQARSQQQQEQQGVAGMQRLHAQQCLAVVLPNGQLQLQAMSGHAAQQLQQTQMTTWLSNAAVSHLLQHPGSGTLLAACTPQSSSLDDLPANPSPGGIKYAGLAVLDPCSGAELAFYQPGRLKPQSITCVGLWDAPFKGSGSPVVATGRAASADAQTASQEHVLLQEPATAAAAAGRTDAQGTGGRRWWWLRRRTAAAANEQQHEQQQHRAAAAATTAAGDRSSSGSEHMFQLDSLLRGLESPGSSSQRHKCLGSSRSSQGSKAVKQRRGPLILLGTEADDEFDGCKGQLLVLQLLVSSRAGHNHHHHHIQQQKGAHGQHPGTGVHGSPVHGSRAAEDDAAAATGGCSRRSSPTDGPDVGGTAAAAASNSSSGGSYSLQRVAKLRLPEAVTAVAGYSDLVLVAAGHVLALYQLRDDRLVKMAYCFTRAPIVSLSVLAAAAGDAGASSSKKGLVMAADMLMGCVAYQVEQHEATGQYSLQPVGAHCDVRQVCQVMCLPPRLLPPVPVAAARAAATLAAELAAVAAAQQRTSRKEQLHQHEQQQQRVQADQARSGAVRRDQPGRSRGRDGLPLGGRAVAAAAAAHIEDEVFEARMRSLCLDASGAVVEVAWAKQRTIPAKWLVSTACIPLGVGGKTAAAPGSLQLIQSSSSDAVAASITDGCVVHLQRLTAAEGQMLMALQHVLLQHPLTRCLVIGGEQLLRDAEAGQQQRLQPVQHPGQLQHDSGAVRLPAGVTTGAAGPATASVPPRLGAVDARVLGLLLLLPHELQLLVLGSSGILHLPPVARQQAASDSQLLQDGLICRLQLLSSSWH